MLFTEALRSKTENGPVRVAVYLVYVAWRWAPGLPL